MRNDAVEIIKERLTMREVLARYGIAAKKRMPCPIHHGKDRNFEVKDKTFCCHSRCGGGDVLTFTQLYFGLSFPDALRKLDTDFGFGLTNDKPLTREEKAKIAKEQAERKAKQKEKEHRTAEAEAKYWALRSELIDLDRQANEHKPKTYEEELDPLFAEAVFKLPQIEYECSLAEIEWRELCKTL